MKLRHALAGLAILTVGPVSDCAGEAAAQTPSCGGHGNTRAIPIGGQASCTNTRVLLDGQPWTVTIAVNAAGDWSADFSRPVPAETAIPIEVAFHFGDSGAGGLEPRTGFLPVGNATTNLAGHVDPAAFADFDCHTQVDIKAFNSDRDTDTNRVRIAGPHFTFPVCSLVPTTSSPSTTPATTTPGVPSSPPATPGTGPATTPVPGGLPATGFGEAVGYLAVGFLLIVVGLGAFIVSATRRRASDGGIDLEAAIEEKRVILVNRWGEP